MIQNIQLALSLIGIDADEMQTKVLYNLIKLMEDKGDRVTIRDIKLLIHEVMNE